VLVSIAALVSADSLNEQLLRVRVCAASRRAAQPVTPSLARSLARSLAATGPVRSAR
jgi:hypothetical protein